MVSLTKLNWSSQFYKQVEAFDIITIFRHVSPDGDAYGSSLGLKTFLHELYPHKKIFLASAEQGNLVHFYEPSDEVSDEIIAQSLAIICDTANHQRVDDQRFEMASHKIKIDHHPALDDYADENFVEAQMSSCCEIIARLALSKVDVLSPKASRYLYSGMLTDTVSFSINSVNAETLLVASHLLRSGIQVGEIHHQLFSLKNNVYDYITYLRSHAIETEEGLIYCFIEDDVLEKFNLTVNQAKEVVNVFKEKESAQVWMLFIKENSGLYRVTMRSRQMIINDVARDFGGGGHDLAAATRDLTKEQTQALLQALTLKLQKLN